MMTADLDTIEADRFREVTALWVVWCNCNGPQPSLHDYKLGQHAVDCQFADRVRVPLTDDDDDEKEN